MPRRPVTRLAAVLLALNMALPAIAQENPVYVDDSPQANELLNQAEDHREDNTGEAVRLYQELLDEYGRKLVPIANRAIDHLVCVRARVLAALRSDEALLARYRMIQEPAAKAMLEAGQVERLAETRPLCTSGLEALLLLSQQHLEAGRFHAALERLAEVESHPDLDVTRRAHLWLMKGTAARFLRDDIAVEVALRALEGAGGDAPRFADELRTLDGPPVGPRRGLSTLDSAGTAAMHDLVAQAIWSVALDESLIRRRYADPVGADMGSSNEQIALHRSEGDLTTAAATVAGSMVYINQGHRVSAINRLTGREVWSYSDLPRLAALDRETESALDLNFVSIAGRSLVTLTGHAYAAGRSHGGKVMCLDADSGRLRWTATLEGLAFGDDEQRLFPHGEPVIAEGKVLVAARKVSRQLLSSTHVVALNLEDGSVAWSQYIASSGILRQSPRAYDSIVVDGAEAFITSSVGGAACVDVQTGRVRWLARLDVPINAPLQDQTRRPWELLRPVLTPTSVIMVSPDQQRLIVFDRQRGDVLENRELPPGDAWSAAKYLVAGDDAVYVVGRRIAALNMNDLTHVLWTYPRAATTPDEPPIEPPPVEEESIAASDQRLDVRGRVQRAGSALIVPTAQALLVLDAESGVLEQSIPIEGGGNPLAVDDQLLIASADRLDAYMSFTRAETMLRERIAGSPDDPEPALSLLQLAMRVKRFPLAMEAAGLARAAAERQGDQRAALLAREELFRALLEVDRSRLASNLDEGRLLFAMLGSIATEPTQRVEYQLSIARFLAAFDPPAAIEQYQVVLSDPALSATWYGDDRLIRPASAWAAAEMSALIVQHGPEVYQRQADAAAARLLQVTGGDHAALAALAEEFPFAPASIEAAREAAAMRMASGNVHGALGALIGAYELAPTAERARELLVPASAYCRQAGWTSLAHAMRDHVLAVHPAVRFDDAIGPSTVAAGAPRIGESAGPAVALAGRVVETELLPPTDTFRSMALLAGEGRLSLYAGEQSLESRWSVPFESQTGQMPAALYVGEDSVVVWQGTLDEDPRATRLSLADGHVLWTTPRFRDIAGDPLRDITQDRRVNDQMPDGQPFDPGQALALVAADTLLLAQRSGGLAAFDVADASEPRWARRQTLEQIHRIAFIDGAIVIAGMSRPIDRPARSADELVARVLVLDPVNGRTIHEFAPRGEYGVKWMTLSPLGQLSYGTGDGVECFNVFALRRTWSNSGYALQDTVNGWQGDGRLVVEDRAALLRHVSLTTGMVDPPFDIPAPGDWDPLDLKQVLFTPGGLLAHYGQRLVMLNRDGRLTGADALTEERDFRWLLRSADHWLAISSRVQQSAVPDQNGRRTQYIYRLYSFSNSGKLLAEPLELEPVSQRVLDAHLIDGWVLLSTQKDTIAVPLPNTP